MFVFIFSLNTVSVIFSPALSPVFKKDVLFVTYKILLNTSIQDLNLSVRAFNGLWWNHIRTIGVLVQCSEIDLDRIRNFGQKTINEIEQALKDKNLHLGMVVPEEYIED